MQITKKIGSAKRKSAKYNICGRSANVIHFFKVRKFADFVSGLPTFDDISDGKITHLPDKTT